MDDPYGTLDCALRSRYQAPADLPSAPLWNHLPAELQSALAEALTGGASVRTVVPLIWQVRTRVIGPPPADGTGKRTRVTARLQLGLLYLGYREGRMGANELLRRAVQVADSYVCGVDVRPFAQLRRELEAGASHESAASRVAALFAPYAALAAECVEHWGLRVPVVVVGTMGEPAEPGAAADRPRD